MATANNRFENTPNARRERAAKWAAAHPVSSAVSFNRKITGMETHIAGVTDRHRGEAAGIRFQIIDSKLGKLVIHRPADGPDDMDWNYAPTAFPSTGHALNYLDEIALAAK